MTCHELPLPASFAGEGASELLREAAGPALEAPASFTRPFLGDSLIVLRESKGDVPRWLWAAAIAVIAILYVLFIGALAIGVARITRHRQPPEPPSSEPAPPAPPRVAPSPALSRSARR